MKVDKQFALLYGIMLGDGCLSWTFKNNKYVAITGNMNDDIKFFEEVINPIFKILTNKVHTIKFRTLKKAIDFQFVDHDLFNFINSFGFPIGKKGRKLFIPEIFYKKRLVKYVISGFFATDGSLVLTDNNGILYPRVEANGIAKNLIYEISEFLNAKGIKCNFYLAKRKNSCGYTKSVQYRLQINGKKNLNKFVKKIGFVNPKHQEKLEYYLKNASRGI